ncbi:ParA family protein [Pararhodospirillum oryzae]|uniref:Chromosome partitioning protein ParA n=1 Tax=Pararhodospirillum oryzae TaxID=478448 RepID=A0A512H3I3_9PROT|nr:ParA family protein [Pararhodospirillum oryzae]GEO79968.1 chromosome partitioning protein ParA [Pararhodospirillum oryzae]
MYVVAVANTKGGCGKTTLATHLAANFAGRGFATALGDLDVQGSALAWTRRRPPAHPVVRGIDLTGTGTVPTGLDRLVVDVPAALERDALKTVVRQADVLVVPALPGPFDEDGLARFLDLLETLKPVRKGRRAILIVANRVHPASRALARLESFLAPLPYPLVARLRDSRRYETLAGSGLSLFDAPPARAAGVLSDWKSLLDALECHDPG